MHGDAPWDTADARKFGSALTVEALHCAIPPTTIRAVLDAANAHEQRERKLTMTAVVWVVIAMHLYSHLALDAVLGKLAKGLRYIWPDPAIALPTASALSYRRAQLGARPLVALFKQVCRPLATPATPGAFLFGLRLMALDGTVEDVPDTPANAAYWGRHMATRGDSAVPQVQAVYLVEYGTPAIVDAGFWPYLTSERVGGWRLPRSVAYRPGGARPWCAPWQTARSPLHDYRPAPGRLRRGASPADHAAGPGGRARPGAGPGLPRALGGRAGDTHQRLPGRVLRSQTPVGVVQELYGLRLAHYAIRVLRHEAACQAGLDPDRLGFVHALEVVRDAIPEFQMTAAGHLPHLLARLLQDLVAKLLPKRRPRVNPRVVKRKMSNFKRKRPQHCPSRPLDRPFHLSLALICMVLGLAPHSAAGRVWR